VFQITSIAMATIAKPEFDLVIFDCDGVLVDSEVLTAEVLVALLAENEIAIDDAVFRADFLGRSLPSALDQLSARTGKKLPSDFKNQYSERLLPEFEARLQAMPGVKEMARRMAVPFCVASSSDPKRLMTSLKCCDLTDLFEPYIFSGSMVRNAKPAPDLFLYAAEHMKILPHRCLVIEDSEMGLQAAKAANMRAWHFRGGSHMRQSGIATEHQSARDMGHLLDLFVAAGLCVPSKGRT
jgi:HAD superfamily hydrolase (TIGR01509 family)